MIKLLQFLWSGCWHEWQMRWRTSLSTDFGDKGSRIECTCKKCGAWTKFDLI